MLHNNVNIVFCIYFYMFQLHNMCQDIKICTWHSMLHNNMLDNDVNVVFIIPIDEEG